MNNNDDEKRETWIDVIKRNCDTVPGFKELFQLIIISSLFIILVVTMAITLRVNKNKQNKDVTTTTTTVEVTTYQDMLNNLLSNSNYKCEIKINDDEYIVTGSYGNNILVGLFENNVGAYKFKLKDGNVYELGDTNTINNELLNNINKDIINNSALVNILKNNSSIKLDNGYKYHNVSINNITYDIEVITNDNRINNINITNDNSSYKLTYDSSFIIE
jgi:hypothetical protein